MFPANTYYTTDYPQHSLLARTAIQAIDFATFLRRKVHVQKLQCEILEKISAQCMYLPFSDPLPHS